MDVITEAKGVMGRWYIGQTSTRHETGGRAPYREPARYSSTPPTALANW